jgi:hypothetical protein
MDNGLIFPYPQNNAHAEHPTTNHAKAVTLSGAKAGVWGLLGL